MDPGTIAIVLGSAVSAMGALQAGQNAEATANANAKNLFQTANAERLAGIENRKRQKRANSKLAGKNRAIDPDKLDLLEDNAMEAALIEADITHTAEIKATSYENKGRSEIYRGATARKASYFAAASQVLIGGGTAFAGSGSFGNLFGSTPASNNAGLGLQFRTTAIA